MQPNQPKQDIQEEVYSVLCSHQTDDGGVKFVLANCSRHQGLKHKIRQWGDGFICSRCSQLITKACNYTQGQTTICYQCEGSKQLQNFVTSREICPHANPQFDRVKLQCSINLQLTHQLDLGGRTICERCRDKLIHKYRCQEDCKICKYKTAELLMNLSSSLANQEIRMVKKMLVMLAERNSSESFKEEIESHCSVKKNQATIEKAKKHQGICKFKDDKQFIQQFSQLNHKEGKYEFFSKCPTHKNVGLKICPTCIAVMLNLNKCPFGCETKSLQQNPRQHKNRIISETGFLILSPVSLKDKGHYLHMFVVRNIAIKHKLDHVETEIRDLPQAEGNQINLGLYPRFGSIVQTSPNTYFLTGGILTQGFDKVSTNNSWLFEIINSDGFLRFKATKKSPMLTARNSHGSVYHNNSVYVVGGFNKKYLVECQKYSIKQDKWTPLPPLHIARSKPTVFLTTGASPEIVVLGGCSQDIEVYGYVQSLGEKQQNWEKLQVVNPNYFQQSAYTQVICSTSNLQLRQYKNILFMGGSNYTSFTDEIFNFKKQNSKFELDPTSLKINVPRAGSVIGVLETGEKSRKKIVVFSGAPGYSVIDYELILVQTDNQTLNPVYSDRGSADSTQFAKLLSSERTGYYRRLNDLLTEQGINMKERIVPKNSELQNQHISESLWMWGRAVCNYSMRGNEKQK